MTARCYFAAALLRQWGACRTPSLKPLPLMIEGNFRWFSSSDGVKKDDLIGYQPQLDLKSRIFKLRFPKRSATDALDRWVREGGKVSVLELRNITTELKRAQRYKHALEICEWMLSHQQTSELTDCDYAVRIDLITRVFGVGAAEEFFQGIPQSVKTAETYTALLHSFAATKRIAKAESLFEKMNESGITLSALSYNEMMTLYISIGQLEKVSVVVEEMKKRNISPDLFTYNLWISSCAAGMDIESVRKILEEMTHQAESYNSWMTYIRLADIYINAGQLATAGNSLIDVEGKFSERDWITYDFLMILHASLGNKDKISEIWKSLQMTSRKMTKRNYICVLSSYILLGHFKEAGDIIEQWKQSTSSSLDVYACKILVDKLEEVGLLSFAEKFHQMMIQIFSWMEEPNHLFQLSPLDHALKLELIAEVHGLSMAEAYFAKIEDLSKKAACLPLLHCYVKDKNTVSAESFMEQIQNMGFLVTPDPFNEMMKLYVSTGQYSKVPLVIQQMKFGNIPLNVLSYNIYMNACSEISGISSVQKVYKEMKNDRHVKMGWSTYATLANIHTKHGSYVTALSALKAAEDTLSTKNRLGYFFLITLYANLQDRDGVLRVWQSSKKVMGRVSCANYMCIILCLLKVGCLEKAESVLESYELQLNRRKYDVRVSNVLLGAYVRSGFIEKAEKLHLHTMKIGGIPNYKTWEILMEGWVKSNQMDKVLDAMNKAFPMLKSCNWRPPLLITMAISEYFEKHVRIEDARKYVKVLRGLNTMNLLLYKSYLRSHIKAQTPILDVRRMMEIDNVGFDEEALSLIQQVSSTSIEA